MKIKVLLVLFVVLVSSCKKEPGPKADENKLPYYADATFTPHWFASNDEKLKSFHKISPFTLYNQDGDTITQKVFDDKIYVTDFFFTTCPGMCPKMMANLADVQDAFLTDDEVLLLSHSVTPTRDSVPVLKAYAETEGIISGKWHLVTGPQLDIYTLGRKVYFVEEDLGQEAEIDDFLHTENFILVDKNRYIRGIYNGLNKVSVKQLIADIHTLKAES